MKEFGDSVEIIEKEKEWTTGMMMVIADSPILKFDVNRNKN